MVAGTGEVGGNLISNLSSEGSEIIAIDPKPDVHQRFKHFPNVKTVQAGMVGWLEADLFKHTDFFLAVTNSDETNMVSCLMAHQMGVKKTICRADHTLTTPAKVLGVDHWINPTEICVEELLRLITAPNSVASFPFCNGQMLLVGFSIKPFSAIVGQSLHSVQSELAQKNGMLVCLQRGQFASLLFSAGHQQQVESGDILYFLIEKQHLQRLRKFLGYGKSGGNKVFINGGGRVGLLLAQKLEQQKKYVKVIEIDENRSKQISTELSDALVLNMEGTNTTQLFAEGLDHADYFIATTNDQPTNILSALIAAEAGVPYSIALVDYASCVPIIANNSPIYLGISPRQLTARLLSQFIYGASIKTYFPIANSEMEILEVQLNTKFKVGICIKDLNLPQGSRVCLVQKHSEILFAEPNVQLDSGDTVVLAAHRIDRSTLVKIFQPE